MNLRQAAQQALEALESAGEAVYANGGIAAVGSLNTAAQALRAALAEPEQDWEAIAADQAMTIAMMQAGQEPVAWYFVRDTERAISFAPDNDPTKPWQPLYTAPPGDVEPVAWMVYTDGGASAYVTDNPNDLVGAYRALPLFTAPTPRKPLTEGEMPTLFVGGLALNSKATTEIVRAVEKAHGIGEQHE